MNTYYLTVAFTMHQAEDYMHNNNDEKPSFMHISLAYFMQPNIWREYYLSLIFPYFNICLYAPPSMHTTPKEGVPQKRQTPSRDQIQDHPLARQTYVVLTITPWSALNDSPYTYPSTHTSTTNHELQTYSWHTITRPYKAFFRIFFFFLYVTIPTLAIS